MGSCCCKGKEKILPYIMDVHMQISPRDNERQEIKKKMWIEKAKNAPLLDINSNPLYRQRMIESFTRSSRSSLSSAGRSSLSASYSFLYGN
ncbi:unnamed protein product [Blepharisma stoltei]|uniref:Uncharacterized protein n=1 Tax=Blepharisma stoltei TaxID=1481888 RepID=A0AAU9K604_9CILI|nr:unnamed protein product [Blepharisma stoltei]